MTNAEKFQKVFGYYATEMWAKPEKEFLEWINEEVVEHEQNCVKCKHYTETEDDTGVHSQCRLESDTMEKIRWYCDRCGEEFIFHSKLKPIEISFGERMADIHKYARREFCDKCFDEVQEQMLSVLLQKGATCSDNAQVDKLRKAAEETEDNGVRKGILKAIEVLEGDTE